MTEDEQAKIRKADRDGVVALAERVALLREALITRKMSAAMAEEMAREYLVASLDVLRLDGGRKG